ncbi:wd repeat-containing protein 47 [Stylonychia lemnae]|uniref:Wd repeat-containing protein 47 n=1 Tax=Stylonychia lemnae TaxID=5949 RepID=A0A078ABS2_STYLE|nr:wd repeat-containing protein 47 [Stylonychia lemnae]|eukprot:CDW79745.1 wd repeat-containing protein 47 [Stylonychia lemnae]
MVILEISHNQIILLILVRDLQNANSIQDYLKQHNFNKSLHYLECETNIKLAKNDPKSRENANKFLNHLSLLVFKGKWDKVRELVQFNQDLKFDEIKEYVNRIYIQQINECTVKGETAILHKIISKQSKLAKQFGLEEYEVKDVHEHNDNLQNNGWNIEQQKRVVIPKRLEKLVQDSVHYQYLVAKQRGQKAIFRFDPIRQSHEACLLRDMVSTSTQQNFIQEHMPEIEIMLKEIKTNQHQDQPPDSQVQKLKLATSCDSQNEEISDEFYLSEFINQDNSKQQQASQSANQINKSQSDKKSESKRESRINSQQTDIKRPNQSFSKINGGLKQNPHQQSQQQSLENSSQNLINLASSQMSFCKSNQLKATADYMLQSKDTNLQTLNTKENSLNMNSNMNIQVSQLQQSNQENFSNNIGKVSSQQSQISNQQTSSRKSLSNSETLSNDFQNKLASKLQKYDDQKSVSPVWYLRNCKQNQEVTNQTPQVMSQNTSHNKQNIDAKSRSVSCSEKGEENQKISSPSKDNKSSCDKSIVGDNNCNNNNNNEDFDKDMISVDDEIMKQDLNYPNLIDESHENIIPSQINPEQFGNLGQIDDEESKQAIINRDIEQMEIRLAKVKLSGYLNEGAIIRAACFCPNNDYIAVGTNSKSIKICRLPDQNLRNQNETEQLHVVYDCKNHHQGGIYTIDWESTNNLICSGSADKMVKVFQVPKLDPLEQKDFRLKVITMTGHQGIIRSVTFEKKNPALILSGGQGDQYIRVWDCVKGTQVQQLQGHQNDIHSIKCSHDGELISSVGVDQRILLWDLRQNKMVVEAAVGHNDGMVSIWDLNMRKFVFKQQSHQGECRGVCWSNNDRFLASAGFDYLIKVFKVEINQAGARMEQLSQQSHDDKIVSIRFNTSDNLLLSSSSDKTARIWSF